MIVPNGSSVSITGGNLYAGNEFALAGNGGTSFTLSGGTLNAGSTVSIGSGGMTTDASQSGGVFNVTESPKGGSLYIATDASTVAVYNLSGGQIQVAATRNIVVGNQNGTGVFNQSGGSVSAGELDLGVANGHGTYSLSAGTLSTSLIFVGYDSGPSSGVFTQTGGTNNTNQLIVATAGNFGTYNLVNGTLNVAGPFFTVVANGGIINQTGGTFNLNGSLYLGQSPATARQTLAGGTLSVKTDEWIAYGSDAEFTQSSGVNNSFDIGVGFYNATGTFNLTGGTLNSTSQIVIGSTGGGIGVMNQSGGAATTSNVYVGFDAGSIGTYNLSGGTHAVGSALYTGYAADSTGTYNVMGGTLTGSAAYVGGDDSGPQGVGAFSISSGMASFSGNVTLWDSTDSSISITGGTLAAGSINLNAPATLAGTVVTPTLNIIQSTTTMGANNSLGAAVGVNIAGGAVLNLAGHGQRIGALSGFGSVQLSGAGLTAGSDTLASTFSGPIISLSGGSFTKAGLAALTLSHTNSYGGGTTVAAGTLVLGATQALPAASAVTILSGAALNTAGFSQTVAGLSGSGVLSIPTGTFTIAGPSTFAGLVEGAGGVNFNGPGTMSFTGANTYSGPTSIIGGTVSVTAGNNLGADGLLNLNGGALQAAGSFSSSRAVTVNSPSSVDVTAANTFTAAGVISGGAALTKTGPGTLVLGGANSLANLTIAAGTVLTTADTSLGGPVATVSINNATLKLDAAFSTPKFFSLSGAAAIDVTAGNAVTFAGTMNGSGLIKTDLGTLVLAGNNLLGGQTSIAAGTLALGSVTGLPSIASIGVAGGATFDLGAFSPTFAGLMGAGTVHFGGTSTLTLSLSSDQTFGGNFTGGGSLVVAGGATLTLTGSSDYTGSTSIAAGTLALAADNALPVTTTVQFGNSATLLLKGVNQTLNSLSGAGIINGASGVSTLTLNTQSAGGDYSGSITNNIAIVKTGGGTQTFPGRFRRRRR